MMDGESAQSDDALGPPNEAESDNKTPTEHRVNEMQENGSPAVACNCNPSITEDLEEDVEKIKGDMIGDTVYSERWVLKCLMNITKKFTEYCQEEEIKELESSFEEDLCTIWDMAAEKDVAQFLAKHDILNLIEAILSECKNPRLMEIMLGILGNLVCQSEIREEVSKQESLIEILAAALTYPDGPALIQLVRLIRACLWELRNSELNDEPRDSFWIKSLAQDECSASLTFIIQSSVEEDLVVAGIKLMETLVYIRLPNGAGFLGKYFASTEVVAALLEGLREITSNSDKSEYNVPSINVEEALTAWVSILHGLTFCTNGESAIRSNAEPILYFLHLIVSNFLEKENWKEYIDEQADFIMCATTVLNLLLPTDFHSGCLANAVTLLERVQNIDNLREGLEKLMVAVAAAEGVQSQMLSTLSECHAPEVELCFLAIFKQDRALLTQLVAELKCINRTDRLCEIANNILNR
ncbi:protein saal1 [Neocloeon triangulifer]|uniref:protein saal1 n=1 Tax=Neocloeon triangulifer TaxID=2078957 RepID=UPI00286F1D39|nr:protein saal1 [Neocloeon triangulifer]